MNVIVFDTETAPIEKGPLDARKSLVYDLGYIVLDTRGEVLDTKSLIIRDVFMDDTVMANAYYADKLPKYYERIGNGYSDAVSFAQAHKLFGDTCRRYNVSQAWAYNCKFDYLALNATTSRASHGLRRLFFPYGLEVCDLWAWAGESILSTKKFCRWAREHGRLTDKGNPSTSAETAYAYLMGTPDYAEEHTALEDAKIESAIYLACKRRKKKSSRDKWGQGWRTPAKVMKMLNN